MFLLDNGSGDGGEARESRPYRWRRRYLAAEYVIITLFASNFIGIAFARTLHYQFYSWYFHSLPILLLLPWSSSPSSTSVIPFLARLLALLVPVGMVEYAFNVYPATGASSTVLQLAHAAVLGSVVLGDVPKLGDGRGKTKSY